MYTYERMSLELHTKKQTRTCIWMGRRHDVACPQDRYLRRVPPKHVEAYPYRRVAAPPSQDSVTVSASSLCDADLGTLDRRARAQAHPGIMSHRTRPRLKLI